MIGSSSLNPSWSSDPFLAADYALYDCFDIELQENNAIDHRDSWEIQSSTYSESPGNSFTSEECDSLMSEDYCDMMLDLTHHDSKILAHEATTLDTYDLDFDIRLSSILDHESATDTTRIGAIHTTDPPRKKRKRTKSAEHTSNLKSWSRMSYPERARAMQSLSEIVSHHMDLKKQIAVIKLIDPNVKLSPYMQEFKIDPGNMTEAKVKRICNYIKKHVNNFTDFNSLINSSKIKSNLSNCHRAKRRPKKCDNMYLNVLELKGNKKLLRQDKKEKLSGLFISEKIIKLSNPQEEEDVNILE